MDCYYHKSGVRLLFLYVLAEAESRLPLLCTSHRRFIKARSIGSTVDRHDLGTI